MGTNLGLCAVGRHDRFSTACGRQVGGQERLTELRMNRKLIEIVDPKSVAAKVVAMSTIF